MTYAMLKNWSRPAEGMEARMLGGNIGASRLTNTFFVFLLGGVLVTTIVS